MPKKQILECFPDDVQDVQSRIIIAHQLRASADIQDKQTKQETGWADTSDRATLMRRAADAIEALSSRQAAGEAEAMEICPDCNGAGGDNNVWTCPRCKGSGGVVPAGEKQ